MNRPRETQLFLLSGIVTVAIFGHRAMGQVVESSGITVSGASTNAVNRSARFELRTPGSALVDSGGITIFPGQTAATTAMNMVSAINNIPNAAGTTITFDPPSGIDITSTQNFDCRVCAGNNPCGPGDEIPPARMVEGQLWDKFISDVPTLSEWSVVVMVLVLLVAGTIVFAGVRRGRTTAA